MDVYNSDQGLSWADQWDPAEQPPPASDDDKKKKKEKDESNKGRFGKKILTLSWIKNLGKKSEK